MLTRCAYNNAAIRCVTFSLHMLKRPSSSSYQAVSLLHSFQKRTNTIPVSSINNSILVKFLFFK
jgi:hypothetical protein